MMMHHDKRFAGSAQSVFLALLGSCLLTSPLLAQVAGDATVGTLVNGQATAPCSSGICSITGGTTLGGNLFHSFDRFSVPLGGEARFDTGSTTGIQNIFSRVTGGLPSNINGTISVVGASSGANLFLINPSGILFGPNASLNVGGSFIASTANSLIFADGSQFSAVAPTSPPLLTISTPIGLQYGSQPGSIQVQGAGNNLGIDAFGAFDHSQPPPPGTLSVPTGKTLALLGGAVSISGGNLLAPGGQIAIGSVGEASTVALTPNTFGWSFGYQGVNRFGDIALSQGALVDASGQQGGAIQVQGRNVSVSGGSIVVSDTLGSGTGAPVSIRATDTLSVSGSDSNDFFVSTITTNANPKATGTGGNLTVEAGTVRVTNGGSISTTTYGAGTAGSLMVQAPTVEIRGSAFIGFESLSWISTFVLPGATGQGGALTLNSQNLTIADGGWVSTNTFGAGNAGNLTVQASNITVSGQSPIEKTASGLFSTVFTGATGTGGNVTITTNQLRATEGASVSASTNGGGNAGTVTLNAQNIELVGTSTSGTPSGVFAQVGKNAIGNGGDIKITTQNLQASQGATVSTSTQGSGNAGNLILDAQNIQLTGTSGVGKPSGLFAQVLSGAKGNGGNLAVTTQDLQLSEGATISTSTFGRGNSGSLDIKATSIEIGGISAQGNPSGIAAGVDLGGTGNGGNLSIEADRLHLFNGAQISTTTFTNGNASDLNVKAGTVLLDGTSSTTRSGLFASAIAGTGNGGNIFVNADLLRIQNGAEIGVSNYQSRNLLPPGRGAAGNIQVDVRSLELDQNSRIKADSAGGSRGNITLNAADLILMRRGSLISTNAQGTATGGNITLSTPFLVAPALENSDITANSVNNRGGQVVVNAGQLFGIKVQPKLTPQSDITASSDLGAEFNGTIRINSLDIDPTKGLVPLSTVLVDPSTRVKAACGANEVNTFVMTGKGGLPQDATQPLTASDRSGWVDWRLAAMPELSTSISERPLEQSVPLSSTADAPIVEASGWRRNQQGQMVLVANASHDREGSAPQVQCENTGSSFTP